MPSVQDTKLSVVVAVDCQYINRKHKAIIVQIVIYVYTYYY